MFGRTEPEVLVVGAGPVGLLTALMLAKNGVRVMVVDRDWRTGAHSYALALHPQSLRMLAQLDMLQPVLDRANRIRTIGVYDRAARRAELQLAAADDLAWSVAVLPQDVLERALEQALERAGVPVLWNHAVSRLTLQPDGAVATVDRLVKESVGYAVARTEWMVAKSRDLRVQFVIGADGHQSLVRRALGLDFPEVGAAQHFAVFEFESDADLGHEMRLTLTEQTSDVVWPLPERRCRWSFQVVDTEAPAASRTKDRIPVEIGGARYPQLDKDRLRGLIYDRAPWFTGQIEQIHWRMLVRFERRLVSSFGRDRVWLAGDAAHLTGPAGMQSMNVGLREAAQLAGILTGALREGGSIEPLQEYNRQRIAEWRTLLGLEGGLVPHDHTDAWIGQHCRQLLPCLPASGPDLAELAEQLQLKWEAPGGIKVQDL